MIWLISGYKTIRRNL